MNDILSLLNAKSERDYGDFTAKLIPNIPRRSILGVRLPALRAMAKQLIKTPEKQGLLISLPHAFHEENLLHAMFINAERELPAAITALRCFLPCVNNWAVCDALRPEAIKTHFKAALPFVFSCMQSLHPYTVRFGIEMLMTYGLKDEFSIEFHEKTLLISSRDYYVNMMRAWYFATALAFRYSETLPYLTENRLDAWTHNKSIQKALESFRISAEQKELLRSLKRTGAGGKALFESGKPPLDVAAAVISSGERLLICKRPSHKARGGLWEFPGGKLEAGETAREALLRECREELDVRLAVTGQLTTLTHIYPDLSVRLFVFEAIIESGEVRPLEHDALAFVLPSELSAYELCDADGEIAALIHDA